MARQDILFPTGRLVGGNLYKPRTVDAEGRPLVYKSGPDVGKPREDFYFSLAIAKNPGEHWASTQWGALIWAAGHAFQPTAGQNPKFAWKVQDGDSQVPNQKGKKNAERVGYPGHWIVSFSSAYAPRIYNRDGSSPITEVDAVKPGYFVQVLGDVDANGSTQQPGVFINHKMIALQAYGEEIVFGPDAASVGFGQGALPAGASAVPAGALAAPPAPGVPGAPPAPPAAGVAVPPTTPVPGATVAPPAPPSPGVGVASAPSAPPATPAAPAVYVQPNPGILTGGVPGATVPGAPPAPPVAPAVAAGPQMTAAAGGMTYEQYRGAGWSDEQLRAQGLMV